MPRLLTLLASLFALSALLAVAPVAAQALPDPVGLVNDFAHVMDDNAEAALEGALADFELRTTAEVAVVTISSLEGTPVEDYAVRLAEKWGIGKKGEDNGVLFLLSVTDRQVRIEVGYGLEPYLTDGQAGRILDTEVVPYLKSGDYTQGIVRGANAITGVIMANGYQPGVIRPRPPWQGPLNALKDKTWLLWGLGGATVYVMAFMARTKSIYLGGVWGGGVGAVLGWIAGGVLLATLGSISLGIVGTVLDAILSSTYKQQVNAGRPTSWRGSYGGFSGAGRAMGGFHFGGGRTGGGGAGRRF